ncbi:MAG: diguanylate cyclase [bacterium]|nr:diguanylate cyclase [bacterium]
MAVEVQQLNARTRQRLIQLLSQDRLESRRLMARLRELRALEGISSFSAALHILAHIEATEDEAETLMRDLLEHRRLVQERLGRDPGLRVAAIDFLSNIRHLLENPTIVEQTQLERTQRSAITDPLTDLYNRRFFQSSLEIELQRSQRYTLRMAVLMFDLDNFKAVNDLYGHPFGDLVLKRTGRVLRRAVREADLACRFGGEEFSVVLPETDRLGAFAVGERVRRQLAENFATTPIEGRIVAMTISGGVAAYPDDAQDPQRLVALADSALYHSKAAGRNRVTPYHAEQRRSVRYPVLRSSSAELAVSGERPVRARPLNLSRGGALLSVARDVDAAEIVELTIGASRDRCTVRGRVVRINDGKPAGRKLIAVAFDRPLADEQLRPHIRRTQALPGGRP